MPGKPARSKPCPGVVRVFRKNPPGSAGDGETERNYRACLMHSWFRDGFYGGLAVALLLGIFLIWLWRAEHQVQLHSRNLLGAIEHKNWTKFSDFIDPDYHDQWGHDRALLLERTREVFRYLRGMRIRAGDATVEIEQGRGAWRAKITVEGDNSEITSLVKERVNAVPEPFRLEWHRTSWKPWDWKLVRVSNPGLEIPTDFR